MRLPPYVGVAYLSAAMLVLGARLAYAQAPLTVQRTDHPSTTGARGIVAADLNHDGWLDLVTAHNDPDGVSVLTNRGSEGGFTRTFVDLPGGPFDIAAGDLNKDGFTDIAVANADSNSIDVLFSSGSGTLEWRYTIAGRSNPRGLTIADMNRDGNLDIVYSEFLADRVGISVGDGQGAFSAAQELPVGGSPQGIAVADFNLDGRPDIAVANTSSGGVMILQATADGSFTRRTLDVPQQQNVLTVDDFDKDGRPDIAAAGSVSSDVTVWLNDRNGSHINVYPSGGGSPRGIVAVDLNRDGIVDLVSGNRGTSTIQVLTGLGDGMFNAAVGFAAGTGSRTVAAGDFDHNGRIDVASGNDYAATLTVLSNTTAFPRAGFGFHRTVFGPTGRGFSGAPNDVADFDRDGRLDVATPLFGIMVYLASGRTVQLPSTTEDSEDLVVADVDRNGYADVIAAIGPFEGPTRVESYLNDGTANFANRQVTQTSLRIRTIETADFNRDGIPDVAAYGSRNASNEFQILLGVGDGTYQLASSSVLPNSFSLAIGDVNRDGAPDIVTQNNGRFGGEPSMEVLTFLNDGSGHFGSSQSTPVSGFQAIYRGALGDVNHDGYADYAGAGPRSSAMPPDTQMVVLLGGASGFTSPVYLRSPEIALSAAIGDLDLDGNADVFGDNGLIFRGRGDGTFEPVDLFDFYAPNPRILDFDADGLPDIAGEFQIGTVQVLLNNRTDENTSPAVTLGDDLSWGYAGQFEQEEATELFARVTDAELHRATFTWTFPDGHTVETGTFPFLTVPILDVGDHQFTVEAHDGRGGIGRDSITVTVTPTKEIVLYVGERTDTFPHGTWSSAADPTAAGGRVLRDVNAGAPKVTTPLATPTNYVDIGFAADASQTYKLWVRLKADGDSSANDSAWLQFTNAVDASGRTFAPGTTSGIEVVLEECSGCGDSQWGWRDEAWGQAGAIGTLTVRFTKGGWQTLRLQTREDGVSIDQIVLSAEKYRTTRPGAVKNDTTIAPFLRSLLAFHERTDSSTRTQPSRSRLACRSPRGSRAPRPQRRHVAAACSSPGRRKRLNRSDEKVSVRNLWMKQIH